MENKQSLIHWQAHEPSCHIDSSLLKRKIIHLDMDAFYASVETRDNPKLKGLPIAVGGMPGGRGVVATASYEARKKGVRSAMPAAQAQRLCPGLIFLKPRFEAYREASEKIRILMHQYTNKILPVSLDEAYLDVTNCEETATKIAIELQNRIYQDLKLTSSAGVGPNKLVAKIASDFNKPFGVTVVTPESVPSFMANLNVRTIPGVGPVTERKLNSFGFIKCQDILGFGKSQLTGALGERQANWLWQACKGIGSASVENRGRSKSIGKERTFAKDLNKINLMLDQLTQLTQLVAIRLRKKCLEAKTIQLKIRFCDFTTLTRAKTLAAPTADAKILNQTIEQLLIKTNRNCAPVRLLGVTTSNLSKKSAEPTTKLYKLFPDS